MSSSKSTKQAVLGLGFFALVLFGIAFVASNANGDQGLRVVILAGRRAEPGTATPITVTVRDTKGAIQAVRVDFGDGHIEEPAVPNEPCRAPLTQKFDFSHAYGFTGFTTVKATVVTGACDTRTETASALQTIEVKKIQR